MRFDLIVSESLVGMAPKRGTNSVGGGSSAPSLLSEGGRSLASETFGNAAFKGCRFCRRPRSAGNPFAKWYPAKQLLQFRSDRHNECLPCLATLRRKHPSFTSEQRAGLAKQLATDDASYENHMSDVTTYEQNHAATLEKRQKDGRALPDPETPEKQPQTVNMSNEAGLEMRKLLGVLWPTSVYETVEGKKYTGQLTTINLGGESLTGVLRPRSCGLPEGATEVYDMKRSYGSTVVQAANSEDALFKDEVQGQWDKVRRLASFSGDVHTNDSGEQAIQLHQGLKAGKDDPFDDLMDFGPSASGGSCA